jgi:nicotinate-nucleotide adenylyltransferase
MTGTSPPQRLGLFGGSFNPVHLGHLLVAQAAQEELRLDRLCFIPAAQSPFKPDLDLAPPQVRLQLLRLALAGQSTWEIDDQEIQRGGVSYTIDTVRNYTRLYPNSRLFYLVGADHLPFLTKWRDAADLARLAEFAVIPRPDEPTAAFPSLFRFHLLRGFPLGVSASQIRDRIQSGHSVDWLLPPAVAETIFAQRLYRNPSA